MDIQAFPIQNNKDTNGFTIDPLEYGMTLRDYFAAKAMQSFCTCCDFSTAEGVKMLWKSDRVAKAAYALADAMLTERDKPTVKITEATK